MPEYFYKHLSANVFDVFIGNGWDNHARITVGRNYAHQVGGNFRLSSTLLKDIHQTILK